VRGSPGRADSTDRGAVTTAHFVWCPTNKFTPQNKNILLFTERSLVCHSRARVAAARERQPHAGMTTHDVNVFTGRHNW
jgi:hypothetical protein